MKLHGSLLVIVCCLMVDIGSIIQKECLLFLLDRIEFMSSKDYDAILLLQCCYVTSLPGKKFYCPCMVYDITTERHL